MENNNKITLISIQSIDNELYLLNPNAIKVIKELHGYYKIIFNSGDEDHVTIDKDDYKKLIKKGMIKIC